MKKAKKPNLRKIVCTGCGRISHVPMSQAYKHLRCDRFLSGRCHGHYVMASKTEKEMKREMTTAVTGMSFGDAVKALKEGKRVARSGWNGKGMYLYLYGAMTDQGVTYQPCIVMFTAQAQHQPGWLASQADILAEDWTIVDGA